MCENLDIVEQSEEISIRPCRAREVATAAPEYETSVQYLFDFPQSSDKLNKACSSLFSHESASVSSERLYRFPTWSSLSYASSHRSSAVSLWSSHLQFFFWHAGQPNDPFADETGGISRAELLVVDKGVRSAWRTCDDVWVSLCVSRSQSRPMASFQ